VERISVGPVPFQLLIEFSSSGPRRVAVLSERGGQIVLNVGVLNDGQSAVGQFAARGRRLRPRRVDLVQRETATTQPRRVDAADVHQLVSRHRRLHDV